MFTIKNCFRIAINWSLFCRRIKKVVSAVTNNLPACPHLYLYSTGDKVIPYQSVELLIEEQRKTGRKVFSVIFGPSAHVDHFRTFPSRYLSELHNFLKECFATVKKTWILLMQITICFLIELVLHGRASSTIGNRFMEETKSSICHLLCCDIIF